jgi:hypothetical protein
MLILREYSLIGKVLNLLSRNHQFEYYKSHGY